MRFYFYILRLFMAILRLWYVGVIILIFVISDSYIDTLLSLITGFGTGIYLSMLGLKHLHNKTIKKVLDEKEAKDNNQK